ncbi:hypothetical protein BKA81DRAFT_357902 [Phyllosticta paracitricarpa]
MPEPTPQGCGSSSMTCCVRRGEPEPHCDEHPASAFQSRGDEFLPNDVFGSTLRTLSTAITTTPAGGSLPLGTLEFTLDMQYNQFRIMVSRAQVEVLDRAVTEAASRTGAPIAGVRLRWGLYVRTTYSDPNRDYAARNNPASYTLVRPSERDRREFYTNTVFGLNQIVGRARDAQVYMTYYSPTHLPQVHRGYRIFYSVDYTDRNGNIISFQTP